MRFVHGIQKLLLQLVDRFDPRVPALHALVVLIH
jgi:hypothetical protein